MAQDEFGGIAVEEPKTDEFGGIPVAEQEERQPELRPASRLEAFRISPLGRRLLGPTSEERQIKEHLGMKPGTETTPGDILDTAFKFASLPPYAREPFKAALTAGNPVLSAAEKFAPAPVQGVIEGAKEAAVNFPIAAGAVGMGKNIGRAAFGLFTGDYLFSLPEQKRAFDEALKRGDKKQAYNIAAQAVLNGAVLGAGAVHEGRAIIGERKADATRIRPTEERIGTAPRPELPAQPPQLRQEEGRQDRGGGGAVGGPQEQAQVQAKTPGDVAREVGGWKFDKLNQATGKLEFTGTVRGKDTTISVDPATPPDEIAAKLRSKAAEFPLAQEILARKPGTTPAKDIVNMTDEQVLSLSKAVDKDQKLVYHGQAEGAAWGAHQSQDVLPELQSMRQEAREAHIKAQKRLVADHLSGRQPNPADEMSQAAQFFRMNWLGAAVDGVKREGNWYTAIEQGLVPPRQAYDALVEKFRAADPEDKPAIQQQIENLKNKFGGKPPPVPKIAAAAYMPKGATAPETGLNHPAILERLGVKGFDTPESRNTPEFGFVLDNGEFVSREQAGPIATVADQNLKDFEAGEPVYSNEVASKPGGEKPLSETKPGETETEAPPVETKAGAPKTPPAAAGKAASEVAKVAATEGQRPAKEVKSELVSRLEDAVKSAPSEFDAVSKAIRDKGAKVELDKKKFEAQKADVLRDVPKVTIEIPGDGTFTIPNTKEALSEVLSRAKKISTVSSEPAKFSKRGMSKEDEEWVKAQIAQRQPISVGPGAASPSDVPMASPLRQLTEQVASQDVPQDPPESRITAAQRVADAWGATKDAASKSLGKVRAGSMALYHAYADLPAWTNFKQALGQWVGADNKTSLEVRNFVKTIRNQIPNALRREAITNWIQAGGDEAVLRQRAAASSGSLKRGYEAALRLTEPEKNIAANIQSYLESRLDEGIKAGLLRDGVENYVNQVWKRENPVMQKLMADLFGNGKLNPNFKFAKKRIFDSYFEGEQSGYSPQTKDVGNLLALYDMAFNKALSARGFIKTLYEGKMENGEDMVKLSGSSAEVPKGEPVTEAFLIKPKTRPADAVTADGRPYRPIDHWALRNWKWVGKTEAGTPIFNQSDMLVHPDIYEHLSNVLKNSKLRQYVVTRALLNLSTLAKQTKLSLSVFHLDQEGLHGMFHRVNPANLVELNLDLPEQKELVDHGLQVADYRAQELFTEGLTGGGLVSKIPGFGHMQQWFSDWLFRDYIPRLKMTMAQDAKARNLNRYAKDLESGKVSRDQLLELTSKEANAAFGELNYRMIGRNPTVQDFLRLGLLAPDFLEARSKFVGQALRPFGGEQRAALALMAGTLYVGARILNQWLDGDPHWDKPFSVRYKGRDYFLRTVLGDVFHLVADPRGFIYNRLSPAIRTITEAVTKRDDRGIKRTSIQQFEDFLKWFIPIPAQRRAGETVPEQILASAGVSSRRATSQGEVFNLVKDWMSKSSDPKIRHEYERRAAEDFGESDYKPIRIALESNDTVSATKEYRKLLEQGKKPDTIFKAMRPFNVVEVGGQYFRHDKPFGGLSRKEENAFVKTLSPGQRDTYNKGRKERLEQFQRFQDMLKEERARKARELRGIEGVPSA